MNGLEWVETTPEIVKYYNPRGLGRSKHFIFQGIHVCAEGDLAKAQEIIDRDLNEMTFGPNEGVRVQR